MTPLLALLLLLAAAPGRFAFAPPDGAQFVATTRTERTLDEGGTRLMTRTLEVRQRTRVRRTEEGFELTVTTLSTRLALDGKPVEEPLLAAMQEVPLVYEVDRAGRLQRVRGFELVEERLVQLFAQQGLEVEGGAQAPAMAERERTQWNAQTAPLVGRPVRSGAGPAWSDALSLPKGPPVPFSIQSSIDGTRPCDGHTCRRLVLKAVRGANTPRVQLSGEGERLLDPATLLPYGERFTLTLTSPGKDGPVVLREVRTITYDHLHDHPAR